MTKNKSAKKENRQPVVQLPARVMHILVTTLCGFLFVFLLLNVVLSQDHPEFVFDAVQRDDTAIIEYFKKARKTDEFYEFYPQVQQIFRQHEGQIYAHDQKRREIIQTLENYLQMNPQSRDVLLALATLHKAEGNNELYTQYLYQAQQIDPAISL